METSSGNSDSVLKAKLQLHKEESKLAFTKRLIQAESVKYIEPLKNEEEVSSEFIQKFQKGGNKEIRDNTNIKKVDLTLDKFKPSKYIKRSNEKLTVEDFKGKDTKEFFNFIKQSKTSKEYSKFIQVHNRNGNPRIKFNETLERASFNPIINTINIKDQRHIDGYIEELAHSYQNQNDGTFTLRDIPGAINELKGKMGFKNDMSHYQDTKSSEYEAHSVISPRLRNEIGVDYSPGELMSKITNTEVITKMGKHYGTEEVAKIKRSLAKEGFLSLMQEDSTMTDKDILKALKEYQQANDAFPKDTTAFKNGGKKDKEVSKTIARVYKRKNSRIKDALSFKKVAGKRINRSRLA
jgi:hypothetical protein